MSVNLHSCVHSFWQLWNSVRFCAKNIFYVSENILVRNFQTQGLVVWIRCQSCGLSFFKLHRTETSTGIPPQKPLKVFSFPICVREGLVLLFGGKKRFVADCENSFVSVLRALPTPDPDECCAHASLNRHLEQKISIVHVLLNNVMYAPKNVLNLCWISVSIKPVVSFRWTSRTSFACKELWLKPMANIFYSYNQMFIDLCPFQVIRKGKM